MHNNIRDAVKNIFKKNSTPNERCFRVTGGSGVIRNQASSSSPSPRVAETPPSDSIKDTHQRIGDVWPSYPHKDDSQGGASASTSETKTSDLTKVPLRKRKENKTVPTWSEDSEVAFARWIEKNPEIKSMLGQKLPQLSKTSQPMKAPPPRPLLPTRSPRKDTKPKNNLLSDNERQNQCARGEEEGCTLADRLQGENQYFNEIAQAGENQRKGLIKNAWKEAKEKEEEEKQRPVHHDTNSEMGGWADFFCQHVDHGNKQYLEDKWEKFQKHNQIESERGKNDGNRRKDAMETPTMEQGPGFHNDSHAPATSNASSMSIPQVAQKNNGNKDSGQAPLRLPCESDVSLRDQPTAHWGWRDMQ